jgi:hypothetical protein
VDDDAGAADDLGGGESPVAFYLEAVDLRRRRLLSPKRHRRSHEEKAGGEDPRETMHR